MNNLNRQIAVNERLVVKRSMFKDTSLPLADRIFVCTSQSFGTSSFTMGTAILGYWEKDRMEDRIEGDYISVSETEDIQQERKFAEASK